MRLCREGRELLDSVTVRNITHKFIIKNDTNNLTMLLQIKWQVNNTQDVSFEGFIIRLTENYQFNEYDKTLQPIQCTQSEIINQKMGHGSDFCYNFTSCVKTWENESCICPDTCDNTTVKCRGILDYWIPILGYIAIPANTTVLHFPVEFRKIYSFNIYPFLRNTVGISATDSNHIVEKIDCPKLVKKQFGVSTYTATETCCYANFTSTWPREIKTGDSRFDYQHNSINLTISWLPPIT
uniref:Uncharacterized protein n=1 Tax=Ciona intestinalis TaxID=7719 RepID=H2XTB1_CIOIN